MFVVNTLEPLSSCDIILVKWIDTPGDSLGEYVFGMLIGNSKEDKSSK